MCMSENQVQYEFCLAGATDDYYFRQDVLWVNAGKHVSPTQLLYHSPTVRQGENRKRKNKKIQGFR